LLFNSEISTDEKINGLKNIFNEPQFIKALEYSKKHKDLKIFEKWSDQFHNAFASSSKNSSLNQESNSDEITGVLSNNVSVENSPTSINNLIDIYNNDNIRDQIENFYNDYFNWMQTLSLTKQGAVIHLVIFLILLWNLFSLITIFYSESLIKYFKLEEKYPRLANIFN
jgi:hypothetical protein